MRKVECAGGCEATAAVDLPVYKHTAACIEPILDELVAGLEVLEQILIVDVIDLYDLVGVIFEQRAVQG